MQRKHALALGLAAAATVSIAAFAQKADLRGNELVRGRSADLTATPKQRLLSQRASTVTIFMSGLPCTIRCTATPRRAALRRSRSSR